MWTIAIDTIVENFRNSQKVRTQLPLLEEQLMKGKITAGWAADQLVAAFTQNT